MVCRTAGILVASCAISVQLALLSLFVSSQAGVVCNNARIEDNTLLGQPTEGALLSLAMKVRCLMLIMMHWARPIRPLESTPISFSFRYG